MTNWNLKISVLILSGLLGILCLAGEYRGVMSPGGEITEESFAELGKWKANLIRKQFMRNWGKQNTEQDIAEFRTWIEKKCSEVDRELPRAQKYGIKLIIDLHTAPGGRFDRNKMRMFYEQKYADEFIRIWQKIAKRYKGDKRILAFDLINEPVTDSKAPVSYWELQIRAAKAIRAIDPDRTIIFEVDDWDSPRRFKGLRKVDLPNVIYQAHMYIPHQFTHQGVGGGKVGFSYPGKIGKTNWNRDQLKKTLNPVREFQLKNKVRIYIGEFSAISWADGAERYLADCISIFEEYGWDWSYHAFREWQGWSVEYAGDPISKKFTPSKDNPRKRALLKGFEKNINKTR